MSSCAYPACVPDRRSQLVAEHMPLVHSLARRYTGRGEPLDDLAQVGAIGLLKAIDRFDSSVGSDFRAFATPVILGEIRRHFRDRTWVLKVPRSVKDAYVTVARAINALGSELGRSPTVAQIVAFSGLSEDLVLDALAAGSAYRPTSLTAAGDDDSGELELPVDDQELGQAIDRASFGASLATLSERERRVVTLRFVDDLTQSQIADQLGISQMHVSRLLRASLERMRGDLVL
jgi:RNA polymerase sigma-B factor